MDQLSRVEIGKGSQQLVANKADMPLLKNLFPDKRIQIGLNKFEDKVEVFIVLGPDAFVELDNILVIELGEDDQLPIGSLSICGILEGIEDLFEGNGSSGASIDGSPDKAIGSTSYEFFCLIKAKDMLFDFFAHRNRNILFKI